MSGINIPKNLKIDHLLKEAGKYCSKDDLETIRLAFEYANDAHRGQKRKSGEPYILHPLATSLILAQMRIESDLIVAAMLHDVPEDTAVTIEDLEKNFGPDIASMVRGITKVGKIKYRGVERYMENLRKMFVAMAEDVRVMIIKFSDRVHNLLTLKAHSPDKRKRIALESLEIYAPIAGRLGMGEFKGMLEDLSFPFIYPKDFERAEEIRNKILVGRGAYLEEVMKHVREELKNADVDFVDVHGREKQLYSFYQKLLSKNWDAEKIYDVVAIRILVKNIGDCYAALGVIHKLWRPLKGRIKDYIAQPKPNGYKSLHTTVFCDKGKIVEFQIRTFEMHDEAEYGIAAHWHYDERGVRMPAKDIVWAKELVRMQKEILKNLSDLEELKVDVFKSRIFVFTPDGDVIDLPEEATPIDFAYHIHTEIGNHCSGAKINDQMVSLETPLKSGDVIEIIIDKNRKGPSSDWLKMAKTHMAKSHIRTVLNVHKKNWLTTILKSKQK